MIKDRVYHIQSFEGEEVPENWKLSGRGTVTLSGKHYKHGKQSLKWRFNKGDVLTILEEENMKQASKSQDGGLIMWIYNEKPINDYLAINLGTKKQIADHNIPYSFNFFLNFRGWRALWVHFREDIPNLDFKGKNIGIIEEMMISAPRNVLEGQIYIDLVEFVDKIYPCRTRDYQISIPRPDCIGRTFWQKSYEYIHKTYSRPLEDITQAQIRDFKIIEKRLEDWIMGTNRYITEEPMIIRKKALDNYILQGIKHYETLEIEKDEEGNITGIPLFASRSPYGKKFGEDVSTTIFLPLVFDYRLNHNRKSMDKLMLLFDYYNDQGWAEGSGLGTLDHETNRSSGYFLAVYLMRDELKKTGRFERECKTVEWYGDIGKLNGEYGIDYIETTADELRTHALYRLLYILMLETSPIKVQAMKNYLKWINSALEITHNFAGTIKPDYTGFHHRGIYANAYTPQGYHMIALINYLLHGTQFEINKVGKENIKKALITQAILSYGYDLPQSLTGRFPEQTDILIKILPAYAYMALAGPPEKETDIDEEMVDIFKCLWNRTSERLKNKLFLECRAGISYIDTLGAMELMLDVEKIKIVKTKELKGFFVKPYGGLVIQRYGDWMVAQKGWSQYIWDYESGGKKKENVYGRYMSYGALQIMAHSHPKEDGYEIEKGWDWNLIPGTTTKYLSLKDLSCEMDNYAHRNFTDQTFLGGVSQQNKIGMFGMILHDIHYDPSFQVKKSTFYFEDEIICLGSDITCEDKKHQVQTTLFQSYIGKNKELDIYINQEKPITELEFEYTRQSEKAIWLMDPYGNGYWIAENQNLKVKKGVQVSRDSFDTKDTMGNYVTAWLDHGKKPTRLGYEYVIKVQTNLQEMCNYRKSYQVIKKDSSMHILNYPKYKTIGYAIFNHTKKIEYGILEKTDTPILVMVKENNDTIIMSICDPDLRLPKLPNQEMTELTAAIPSKEKVCTIKLKGNWDVLEGRIKKVEQLDKNTQIEIEFRDGETKEIVLKKVI